jgi:hypothetical protein
VASKRKQQSQEQILQASEKNKSKKNEKFTTHGMCLEQK